MKTFCPDCGNKDVMKKGLHEGKQTYQCSPCQKRFYWPPVVKNKAYIMHLAIHQGVGSSEIARALSEGPEEARTLGLLAMDMRKEYKHQEAEDRKAHQALVPSNMLIGHNENFLKRHPNLDADMGITV